MQTPVMGPKNNGGPTLDDIDDAYAYYTYLYREAHMMDRKVPERQDLNSRVRMRLGDLYKKRLPVDSLKPFKMPFELPF
jgi:hypothetical protein